LSGGGAKGFAHIGVLKVLEQAGVKIDYHWRNKYGSSCGRTCMLQDIMLHQLDSIFKATNFDELIKDFIPRSSKIFTKKETMNCMP
jgi:NTE family protein